MTAHNRLAVILLLGTTQTLGWASSFYLPAILGDRIAQELGISSTWFFAAFSASLVVSALVGPRAGRTVDAIGGREVLAVSNVILAVGLAVLAFAHSQAILWLAWLILGLGMGIGLYDTAFAALGRIYGLEARSAITGITLLAGFASTVGWPLTAWGASELGWRETCLAWAGAHIVLGLPLNLLLPKSSHAVKSTDEVAKPDIPLDRPMLVLGFAFAASWTVVTAMAVHLPRLLEAAGASAVQAVAAGALDRSLAGWCPHPGSELDEAHPSDGVSSAFGSLTSARRNRAGPIRCRGSFRAVHRATRRRQRHTYDCAWDRAARYVRPRKLRLPAWAARCAVPSHDGGGTIAVRRSH